MAKKIKASSSPVFPLTLKIQNKNVVFDSMDDFVDSYLDKLEALKIADISAVDKDGLLFRESGVTPEDLKLVSLVAGGNTKALMYLVFKYKKDGVTFDDYSIDKELKGFKVEPPSVDLEKATLDRAMKSLNPGVRNKFQHEILDKWDTASVKRVTQDLPSFLVMGDQIERGIFDEVSFDMASDKIKTIGVKPDFDRYLSCLDKRLCGLEADLDSDEDNEEDSEETPEESSNLVVTVRDVAPITRKIISETAETEPRAFKDPVSTLVVDKYIAVEIPEEPVRVISTPVRPMVKPVVKEDKEIKRKKSPPVGLSNLRAVVTSSFSNMDDTSLLGILELRGDFKEIDSYFDKEYIRMVNEKNKKDRN